MDSDDLDQLWIDDATVKVSANGSIVRVRLVFVSHCWESKEHPDPWGFQLAEVVKQCDHHLKNGARVWIFFDYISLHQFKRIELQEQVSFSRAMAGMHLLYAHEAVEVIRLEGLTPTNMQRNDVEIAVFREAQGKVVPVPVAELTLNRTPYHDRGWCQTEKQWSSLRDTITHVPMPPSMFREKMSQLKFTHRDDRDSVIKLQALLFYQKTFATTQLLLQNLDDDQVAVLVEALPCYGRLREIVVNGNRSLGARGAAAVVESRAHAIEMESCNLGRDEALAIEKALRLRHPGKFERLNLDGNDIDDVQALHSIIQDKFPAVDFSCKRDVSARRQRQQANH